MKKKKIKNNWKKSSGENINHRTRFNNKIECENCARVLLGVNDIQMTIFFYHLVKVNWTWAEKY